MLNKTMTQDTAILANGQIVKEGDKVRWVTSDGEQKRGAIKRRQDGSLYFWNSDFPIIAYISAEKVED